MSQKDETKKLTTSGTAAEILAATAEGSGDLELAQRFAGAAAHLAASAEQSDRWHEEEVRGVATQLGVELERTLKYPPTPSRYEDGSAALLEARSTDAVEEGIIRFYRGLGLGAAAEAAKPKVHNMVIGVGSTARRLAEKGVIPKSSALHNRSQGDRDPAVWRMSRKTINTGLGFALRETRYSSRSRRVTRRPDVVEVDAVFPKAKKPKSR